MPPRTFFGRSKSQLAALVATRLGVLAAIRQARLNRGLLVLAYHRIGDAADCPVDGGLYSVTAEGLADQVRLLKRWLRVTDLAEVEAAYRSGKSLREPLALLTFDDVYRDNFTTAFPVLKQAGVSGVFFVPTGLIEQGHLPWWDRLAYAVKNAPADECRLTYPEVRTLTRLKQEPAQVIRGLHKVYKSEAGMDKERFVRAVEEATGAAIRDRNDLGELFASWSELREMHAGGMALASHTHTHCILSHLSLEEQCEELGRSRDALREHAGVDTRAVAYPNGARASFNEETRQALERVGYELGFSHYDGWNPAASDRYDVRRARIDPGVNLEVFEAVISLPSVCAN